MMYAKQKYNFMLRLASNDSANTETVLGDGIISSVATMTSTTTTIRLKFIEWKIWVKQISLLYMNICDYDTNTKMYLNLCKPLFPHSQTRSYKSVHSWLQTRFVQWYMIMQPICQPYALAVVEVTMLKLTHSLTQTS